MAKDKIRFVACSESGRRIGEDNPMARHSNAAVDEAILLRAKGLTLRRVAAALGIPKSTVWDICTGRTRAQLPHHFKRDTKQGGDDGAQDPNHAGST